MKDESKQDIMISARVTPWMKQLIEELAEKDERTISWTIRRLLAEALDARGLLNDQPMGHKGMPMRQDVTPRKPASQNEHLTKH